MMITFGRRTLRLLPWYRKNEQRNKDEDAPLLAAVRSNESHNNKSITSKKYKKISSLLQHSKSCSSRDNPIEDHTEETSTSYRWTSDNPPPLISRSSSYSGSSSTSDRSSCNNDFQPLFDTNLSDDDHHHNTQSFYAESVTVLSCSKTKDYNKRDLIIPNGSGKIKKTHEEISLLTDCDDTDRRAFDLEDVAICGLDNTYIKEGLPEPEIPTWILQPDFVWLMPPASASPKSGSITRKKLERIHSRRKDTTNDKIRKYKRKRMVGGDQISTTSSNHRSRCIQLVDQVRSTQHHNRTNNIVTRFGSLFVSTLPTVSEVHTVDDDEIVAQGPNSSIPVALPKKPRLQYSFLQGISTLLPVSGNENDEDDDNASHFSVNSSHSNHGEEVVVVAPAATTITNSSEISYVKQGYSESSDNSTITTTHSYYKEENCHQSVADDTSTTMSSISWSIATNNDFVWNVEHEEKIQEVDYVDSSDHENES